MSSRPPAFSTGGLQHLLSLLNRELELAGITGEICIVGGEAMVLAFGNRASTRDIDALVMARARQAQRDLPKLRRLSHPERKSRVQRPEGKPPVLAEQAEAKRKCGD